ncbi:polysaccharide biosynthesis C-terminal domain-containing protein [Geomonas nitrogeniifigens]|uniref:Polysaccharide biosynthesis C-terminal domain-containing protein n=1 Tax=Geomonas diazotrophica TaxID=2843197 RepID=A0ABX8JK51_9BACT|nr:polysaccharide biosynthesis C-terminal domain-containing protein [Geomonas nitrogeniifigens]QWV95850.1 polysaccharide biosynthesis C-terminal domain-containing protein [Geomonas nitrogeniifigens]QXE84935.1 polysaccharide biosynthesis C-terminal domain-containing protein [Geomonas nitrogeniifigens]
MKKQLILNSCSGVILYAVNILVAFVMSPVVIRALGNRDYGVWELVMSVVGYMGLLDLGVGPALVRFVAVASGKEDRDDMRRTMSTSFAFFLAVGVAVVLAFILLGYFPYLVGGRETGEIANIGTVFLLFGLNAALVLPQQVFIATLMGVQRHYFINLSRGVLALLRAVLTFYLLRMYAGRGLIVLALLEPLFSLVQLLLFAAAVQLDPQLPRMSRSAVSWGKLGELFSFGVKNATMQVAGRLQNQSVPFIIGHVLGLGTIVYFAMPNRLIDYAKGLALAIGFPLTPYFSSTYGKGVHDELVTSWLNTSLALQIVTLAMPVAIFYYGETFLALWIGRSYAVAGRWVLYCLLVGLVADALASNAFRMLTAQGQHGRSALVWLVMSALSIPLGIAGARVWGVAGAALGTTVTMVVGNLVTLVMTCRLMKLSLRDYARQTLQRLLLPLLFFVAAAQLLARLFPVSGYAMLILQLACGGAIYLAAVWFLTLPADTRGHFTTQFKARFYRSAAAG